MNCISFLKLVVGRNGRDLMWLIFELRLSVAIMSGRPILMATPVALYPLGCRQAVGHSDSEKLVGGRQVKWTLIQTASLQPVLELAPSTETGILRASSDWEISNT